VAPNSAIFHRHALQAQLVSFQSEDALTGALGAGTIDAASMNLPALLKPLASGSDIRVVAGLHAGCLRVVATDDVVMHINGTMKGTVIATDRLHGSSMNLLSALLRRQGNRSEARRDLEGLWARRHRRARVCAQREVSPVRRCIRSARLSFAG